MDPAEFRLSWHADSWKELNKQLPRRTIFYAGVGFLLLWRVLTPFTALDDLKSVHKKSSIANEQQMLASRERIKRLKLTEKELSSVEGKLNGFAEGAYRGLRRRAEDLKAKYLTLRDKTYPDLRKSIEGRSTLQGGRDGTAVAARFINLTMSRIRAEESSTSPRDLIDKLAREKFGKLITEGVDEMVANLQRRVLRPLRTELAESKMNASLLDADMSGLDTFVANWKQNHNSDRTWANTVMGKEDTLSRFRDSVRRHLRRMRDRIGEEVSRSVANRRQLEKRESEILVAQADLQSKTKELEGRMHTLLPTWLREYLSVDETFVYFPLLLLLATLHLTMKAGSMLVHYRALRRSWAEASVDAAPPSMWTLAWRSGARAPATLLAYAAVVGIMWFLFEWSMGLAKGWQGGSEIATFRSWLPTIGVLGRMLFIAMTLGVLLALATDRRALRAAVV